MAKTNVLAAALEQLVFPIEGGLTLDRNDAGNWTGGRVGAGELKGTNMGISAAMYPDEDIQGMTKGRATELYGRDYWDVSRCADLPDSVAYIHFDSAIQHGTRDQGIGCEELLQRAAGVMDDGIIGPKTLAAVRAMPAHVLLARYVAVRLKYYITLSTFDRYGRGWTRRMANVAEFAARW